MTLVDFEAARREKILINREIEVEKYVHLTNYELFDSWIEKEESSLTEKKLSDCAKQMEFIQSLGHDPKNVFDDVVFYDPDGFMHDYKLDWLECLEAALTFFAYNRKNNKEMYELTIMAHPFLGPLSTL